MASRNEPCSGCGRQLRVPQHVTTFQCSVCQTISGVRPFEPPGRANNLVVNKQGGSYKPYSTMAYSSYPYPGSGTSGFRYANGNNYNYTGQPQRSLAPPPAFWGKRAVLCGINYYGTPDEVRGCVENVIAMTNLLVYKLGFPRDCIRILTDAQKDPKWIPTAENIRENMRWLVQDCQPGESLVFQFAGHGNQRQDNVIYDELDKLDEGILSLDNELIIDDEINETIVRPLPIGAKLHAIFDTCHSGTILDLRFLWGKNSEGYYFWKDQTISTVYKGTSGGVAVCFGACDDFQQAWPTSTATGHVMGAMTLGFIKAMSNEPGLTYGRLINVMQCVINNKDCPYPLQEARLSSSVPFDIYTEQVIL